MRSGVYGIEDKETGRWYVGWSSDIERRWYQHRHALKRGKHHSTLLQETYDERGLDNFNFVILELLEDKREGKKVEQKYIDFYRSKTTLFNYDNAIKQHG